MNEIPKCSLCGEEWILYDGLHFHKKSPNGDCVLEGMAAWYPERLPALMSAVSKGLAVEKIENSNVDFRTRWDADDYEWFVYAEGNDMPDDGATFVEAIKRAGLK